MFFNSPICFSYISFITGYIWTTTKICYVVSMFKFNSIFLRKLCWRFCAFEYCTYTFLTWIYWMDFQWSIAFSKQSIILKICSFSLSYYWKCFSDKVLNTLKYSSTKHYLHRSSLWRAASVNLKWNYTLVSFSDFSMMRFFSQKL